MFIIYCSFCYWNAPDHFVFYQMTSGDLSVSNGDLSVSGDLKLDGNIVRVFLLCFVFSFIIKS